MLSLFRTTAVAAVVAVGLMAQPVFADTVKHTGASISPTGVGITISGGGLASSLNTTAGQIMLTGVTIDSGSGFQAAPDLAAWCVDIFHVLAGGGTFSTSTALAPSLLVTIEKLIIGGSSFNDGVTVDSGLAVANNNAATQLAIWKAVFNPPEVTTTNATINTLANQFLTYAANSTNGFVDDPNQHVVLLDPVPAGSTQRLAFLADGPPPSTDVPEPATLALLSVGLIGLGVARRRRTRH